MNVLKVFHTKDPWKDSNPFKRPFLFIIRCWSRLVFLQSNPQEISPMLLFHS